MEFKRDRATEKFCAAQHADARDWLETWQDSAGNTAKSLGKRHQLATKQSVAVRNERVVAKKAGCLMVCFFAAHTVE